MSLGIYIHWPYCARICPYCDFNVYRGRDIDETPLVETLIADMRGHAGRMGPRVAETLFLGGGTPSLLSDAAVAQLIAAAREVFALRDDAEVTLEANPEDAQRFGGLVGAGVNRLSLGVQALDDDALKVLGRAHDVAMARAAVDEAARTGARVSVDLIYAREGQRADAWARELRQALTLPAEHFSLYQLTIEPETAFGKAVARGAMRVPDNEEAAALYELTQELCEAAGFPAYEVSNHARSAEARSAHNLIYWRSGEWLGLGPGAHGRVCVDGARLATKAFDRPEAYIDAVNRAGIGWDVQDQLDADAMAQERIGMGLRSVEGVAREPMLSARAIQDLEADGYLRVGNERLTLTMKGRLVADRIVSELLAD